MYSLTYSSWTGGSSSTCWPRCTNWCCCPPWKHWTWSFPDFLLSGLFSNFHPQSSISALFLHFFFFLIFRCWTSLLRSTRVQWKSLPLWSSLKRVTKWAPLRLHFFQSSGFVHSLMALLWLLCTIMDLCLTLRCLISQKMISLKNSLLGFPWSLPCHWLCHTQLLLLHPICLSMDKKMLWVLQ